MFYDVLRDKRERLGITQREFANLINVSYSTYRAYEDGRFMPTSPVLIKLVSSGVDFNTLFAEELEYEKKQRERNEKRRQALRQQLGG